jgi:hypothetical protein
LAWRVEFRLQQEEEERQRQADKEARAEDKKRRKEEWRAVREEPTRVEARRERERERQEGIERRRALRILRFYAMKSMRERFQESFLEHLKQDCVTWVAEEDLEERVLRALDNPQPLWEDAAAAAVTGKGGPRGMPPGAQGSGSGKGMEDNTSGGKESGDSLLEKAAQML